MSDPFTDLRNSLRDRHDVLKREIARCKDPEQGKLLRAQKKEIWHVWNRFLFQESHRPEKPCDEPRPQ